MRTVAIHDDAPTPADAPDFNRLRRVLVVKLRYHGDVLLCAPVFTTLKRQFPHLELDALVYAETRDMLAGHPALAELHCIDRHWKEQGLATQLRAETALVRTLRARRYDLLIHLTEHWRGAWLARLLAPTHAVTPRFERRRGRFWRRSFSHHYPVPPRRHKVEVHLDALRRLGVHPAPADKAPSLQVDAATLREVARILDQQGVRPHGYVHLHPGSRFAYKTWNAEGLVALIAALRRRHIGVVVTAAPAPAELAVVARLAIATRQDFVNLAGQLTLKQLAAVAGLARVFVGVDSAPMHIAAAMDTPVVALFGATNPHLWGPWSDRATVLASGRGCQPCQLTGCANSQVSDCLHDITPAQVLAAVLARGGWPLCPGDLDTRAE